MNDKAKIGLCNYSPQQLQLLSIALAVLLTGCASSSIAPPVALWEDAKIGPEKITASKNGFDPYLAFNKALSEAQANHKDSALQATLLQEGMSLVAARCAHYFAGLGSAEQHLRFARRETALTGGITSAMMGLANASTKAVANTASIFSFTAASMDTYLDSYIYSPEVKALQTLVMDAMNTTQTQGVALVNKVRKVEGTLSYTQVYDFLSQMEAYCQPHGVRDLVTKAVSGVRTTPASPAPTPGPASLPAPTAQTPAPVSPPAPIVPKPAPASQPIPAVQTPPLASPPTPVTQTSPTSSPPTATAPRPAPVAPPIPADQPGPPVFPPTPATQTPPATSPPVSSVQTPAAAPSTGPTAPALPTPRIAVEVVPKL